MDRQGDQSQQIINLLRSMRDDGARLLAPQLQGIALERLQYTIPVLDRLATDLAVRPLSTDLRASAVALLSDIDRAIGRDSSADEGAPHAPMALQQSLVGKLRVLADASPDPQHVSLWQRAAALGATLRVQIEAARPPTDIESPETDEQIDSESLTRYLRRHWPDAPEISVQSLQRLNGGRSKKTMFVKLSGHPRIEQIVLRQDVPSGMIATIDGNTCVASEYPLLRAAYAAGLPVPEPLWLEAESTELGAPFMLTRKLAGSAPGDWRGFHQPGDAGTRVAVLHLAEVLAGLHRLALPEQKTSPSTEQMMQREIDYRWKQWRQDALAPFPLIECAFQRLREECRQGLGAPVLVHGDVLPHNLLFDQGRVSGLLDWEFAHAGDLAEDLAYCRTAVSAVLPWSQFLDRYHAAGGTVPSERRLAIYGLYGLVRNSGLLASAGRMHSQGKVADFGTGAIAYVSLPMMESLIGAQLEALDAITQA